MFIHDMTDAECRQVLREAKVGRLACARGNQPYIVPIYFAYSEHHLYAVSTIGQKIEWMRANPLVCVQLDELTSPDEWISVIVFGRYEELPDIPENKRAREQTLALLQRRSVWWWEPACIPEDHRDSPHSCTPVAYRIHIDRVSGHHTTPDKVTSGETRAESKPAQTNLISNLLARVRHQRTNRRSLQ
jgi:nitroimidazol reductase NimA-like FMN-containing flavoprotein (pyridoxamine 5'-phosphate oxidase superfamily)